MRVQTDPLFPADPIGLTRQLTAQWRRLAQLANGTAEGSISACYNALTAPPTTGAYQQGDFVRNKEPAELGAPGAKYIIHGWQCVESGEPGTWVEARYLTGN